jgi:RNA exonuclease 4
MAVFRLHRKTWESGRRPEHAAKPGKAASADAEGSDEDEDEDGGEEGAQLFPGGGRKGVSSGLSVVVTRRGGKPDEKRRARPAAGKPKAGWWKEMG